MANVVVLGGGISGLSCAYYLSKYGKHVIKKVTLLDRSTRLGGWISSTRFPDGTVYEHGPRSMRLHGNPGFNSLCLIEELGLASDVLAIGPGHAAANKRMILVDNKLHLLPTGIRDLFRKRAPFSQPMSFPILKDLLTRKSKAEDETVHSFASRRFGKEVAELVFDPLCRGIVASDSKILSVKSVFPSLFEAEQKHRSVIKGQLKSTSVGEDLSKDILENDFVKTARQKRWRLWTLKNGLQALPDRIIELLENDDIVQVFPNMPCDKIHFENGKASVHFEGEGTETEVDHIFAAVPAKRLSRLVGVHPKLATPLSSISTVHVGVVNLEYKGKVLKDQGFGFLVPSNQDCKVLGVTFDSCLFPEHDGNYTDKTRITCMMGGHWFSELFGPIDNVSLNTMLHHAIEAASKYLNINEQPVHHHVSINRNCIPEYRLNHEKLIKNLKSEIEENNMPLTLLGASYSGLSVNECIYNAKLAAQNYVKALE